MIIAFSPDQAHEVAQAFDAPWFFGESLYPSESSYPTYIHRENTNKDEKKEEESSSYPTYIHKEKTSRDEKKDKSSSDEDAKPAAKESPEKSKKSCRRNAYCNPNGFHPCHAFYRAARCAQQAAKRQAEEAAKIIEQRSPIHYHDETPELAKMSLDITGFTSEDITINVDDFVVSIKGKRTNKLGDVFVLDRKFRLDKKTVNLDGVAASFEDGILELTVPKKAKVGPRTIPISVSSSASTASTSHASTSHEGEPSKSAVEEENVPANTVEVEVEVEKQAQSSDESGPDDISDTTKEQDSVEVETVQEEERNDEKEEHEESQSTPDNVTDKSAEDETWEEVSE